MRTFEDLRSKKHGLGLQHCQGGRDGRVKRSAELASGGIVDRSRGRPLPRTSGVNRLVRVCRRNGGLQGELAERWKLETAVTQFTQE